MNMQPPSNVASQTATEMGGDNGTQVLTTFLHDDACEAMVSGNGDGEESEARTPRSSHACPVFADTLHELANAVTAVLINAQVLEWKLPPYSRLKRPAREIERHAQRGGALVKRLLHQLETTEEAGLELCSQVPSLHGPMLGNMAAVTGPDANAAGPANLPPMEPLPPAPGPSFPSQGELTSLCDLCTSAFFPKEE